MYQRIQALELASRNSAKSPQISAYANTLFCSFRKLIRKPFEAEKTFSSSGKRVYWSFRYPDCVSVYKLRYFFFRGALTLSDLSTAFESSKNTHDNEVKPPSPRGPDETGKIFEHVEDVLEEAFKENVWTLALEVFF